MKFGKLLDMGKELFHITGYAEKVWV